MARCGGAVGDLLVNQDSNILRFLNPKPQSQPSKLKSQKLKNKKIRIYLGFVKHLPLFSQLFSSVLRARILAATLVLLIFMFLSSAIDLGRGRCRKCDETAGEQ